MCEEDCGVFEQILYGNSLIASRKNQRRHLYPDLQFAYFPMMQFQCKLFRFSNEFLGNWKTFLKADTFNESTKKINDFKNIKIDLGFYKKSINFPSTERITEKLQFRMSMIFLKIFHIQRKNSNPLKEFPLVARAFW